MFGSLPYPQRHSAKPWILGKNKVFDSTVEAAQVSYS